MSVLSTACARSLLICVCACVKPFQPGEHLVESSAKLTLLDRVLKLLQRRQHRALIFSQSTRVLDIIQDYLAMRGTHMRDSFALLHRLMLHGAGFAYERIDGSVRSEERYAAMQKFRSAGGAFVFLLSTRAGGVGINLVEADTVSRPVVWHAGCNCADVPLPRDDDHQGCVAHCDG
jgi:chromodomain-helicase-DNA-binding protein 1-like